MLLFDYIHNLNGEMTCMDLSGPHIFPYVFQLTVLYDDRNLPLSTMVYGQYGVIVDDNLTGLNIVDKGKFVLTMIINKYTEQIIRNV